MLKSLLWLLGVGGSKQERAERGGQLAIIFVQVRGGGFVLKDVGKDGEACIG